MSRQREELVMNLGTQRTRQETKDKSEVQNER